MTLQRLVLSLHVLVAVLGLGQVAALLLFTGPNANVGESTVPLLRRLVRGVSLSLALLLLTGVYLLWRAGGVFVYTWWFRDSMVVLVLLGFVNSRAMRALRTDKLPDLTRKLRPIAWALCLLVAIAVWLMVGKPG
jgi:hypothetical protein